MAVTFSNFYLFFPKNNVLVACESTFGDGGDGPAKQRSRLAPAIAPAFTTNPCPKHAVTLPGQALTAKCVIIIVLGIDIVSKKTNHSFLFDRWAMTVSR